jgi:hypothetical protein
MTRTCLALLGAFAAIVLCASVAAGAGDSLTIFQRRILPILSAKNASSCSECHLSGVDLKDYIRPTQEETFAALKGAGLIDSAKPEASKLLAFIARKPDKPSLITDKVRREEYEAFRAWIAAAVKDPALGKAKTTDETIGPDLPKEVIRHARKDRVLASFLDNVWSEVARCAHCHSPERNAEQVKKHGEHISWIKLGNPQATLDHLREHELLDLESPEKSLFLLKPLNQVMHGGGQKMAFGDRTYQQFRGFIEDLAATEAGRYQSADQLPEPPREHSIATGIWLKITDVPAKLDKLVLQADVYRWDERSKSWSSHRWATGDRLIAGDRQLWQQHLSLVAPRESERAAELGRQPSLPAGKYLVRIYVDQENRLEKEYPTSLGAAELVGEVEVTSRWPEGYGSMTVVKFQRK